MLNKLLCKIFGHKYNRVITLKYNENNQLSGVGGYEVCKRCRKQLNDD